MNWGALFNSTNILVSPLLLEKKKKEEESTQSQNLIGAKLNEYDEYMLELALVHGIDSENQ